MSQPHNADGADGANGANGGAKGGKAMSKGMRQLVDKLSQQYDEYSQLKYSV